MEVALTGEHMTKDTALDLALEALDGIHPGNMTPMAEEYWNKAASALRTAIEQAEKQEPVAWIKRSAKGNIIDLLNEPDDGAEPIYTHPPKRQWVGLMDEEIDSMVEVTDLSGAYYYDDLYAVARAIEAKLKDKNT